MFVNNFAVSSRDVSELQRLHVKAEQRPRPINVIITIILTTTRSLCMTVEVWVAWWPHGAATLAASRRCRRRASVALLLHLASLLLAVACHMLPAAAVMGGGYAIPRCSSLLANLAPHQRVALRDAFQQQQQQKRDMAGRRAMASIATATAVQGAGANAGRRVLQQVQPQDTPATLRAMVARLSDMGVLPGGISMATLGACVTARLDPQLFRDQAKFTFMVGVRMGVCVGVWVGCGRYAMRGVGVGVVGVGRLVHRGGPGWPCT